MSRRRSLCTAWVLSLTVLFAPPAAAADSAKAASLELLQRARRLMMSEATLGEACQLLQQSLTLYDRGDTLLNLAECHRRQGRSATAWAEFDRALRVGTQVGFSEAVQAATRLRDDLGARLSRLRVEVPEATAGLPDFKLLVNDQPWPRENWNVAVACDPGDIAITATARGYEPFRAKVALGPEKDAQTIAVGLQPLRSGGPTLAMARPPRRPLWPWIVGGAGVALAAVGVAFEVDSRSAGRVLDAQCGAGRQSCPLTLDYASLHGREVRSYDLFVGLGLGGALAVGAAGLGLALSSRRASTRSESPVVVVTATSVSLAASF